MRAKNASKISSFAKVSYSMRRTWKMPSLTKIGSEVDLTTIIVMKVWAPA